MEEANQTWATFSPRRSISEVFDDALAFYTSTGNDRPRSTLEKRARDTVIALEDLNPTVRNQIEQGITIQLRWNELDPAGILSTSPDEHVVVSPVVDGNIVLGLLMVDHLFLPSASLISPRLMRDLREFAATIAVLLSSRFRRID